MNRNIWPRKRRALALFAACAAVAGVILGFTVFDGSGRPAGRPVLHVVHAAPLLVRGERFRPGERVRVTAGTRTARVTAGSDGVFVITLRGATRCDWIRLVAVGSRASYAVLKQLPPPACMPLRGR